jgi:hypothetical protein
LFPPNPTVALSATTATPGQSVSITDAAGATTYWWLSTLNVLQGASGGVPVQRESQSQSLTRRAGRSLPCPMRRLCQRPTAMGSSPRRLYQGASPFRPR